MRRLLNIPGKKPVFRLTLNASPAQHRKSLGVERGPTRSKSLVMCHPTALPYRIQLHFWFNVKVLSPEARCKRVRRRISILGRRPSIASKKFAGKVGQMASKAMRLSCGARRLTENNSPRSDASVIASPVRPRHHPQAFWERELTSSMPFNDRMNKALAVE